MSIKSRTLGMPDVLDEYETEAAKTLDGLLGFNVTSLSETSATAEFQITEAVCQRFGIVHGGAYAALAEMLATEATVARVWDSGNTAVGQSNHTSFISAARSGKIVATALPIHRGRRTWVWDVTMRGQNEKIHAVSRVTVAVLQRRDD